MSWPAIVGGLRSPHVGRSGEKRGWLSLPHVVYRFVGIRRDSGRLAVAQAPMLDDHDRPMRLILSQYEFSRLFDTVAEVRQATSLALSVRFS
nr:hypothetical protein CFP56_52848 [Quercus suber]